MSEPQETDEPLILFTPFPRTLGLPDIPSWVIFMVAIAIAGAGLMGACCVYLIVSK